MKSTFQRNSSFPGNTVIPIKKIKDGTVFMTPFYHSFFCKNKKERRDNMLDIKFVRENKELVKENIKKKFQDEKLPLVDEVVDLD